MDANQITNLKLNDISEMLRAVEDASGEKYFRGERHHKISLSSPHIEDCLNGLPHLQRSFKMLSSMDEFEIC